MNREDAALPDIAGGVFRAPIVVVFDAYRKRWGIVAKKTEEAERRCICDTFVVVGCDEGDWPWKNRTAEQFIPSGGDEFAKVEEKVLQDGTYG